MIDVVFPLGSGSVWQNNELRYALRALERNFLDLGRVFVVGVQPHWLREAVCIPFADRHKRNKDANLIDKVLAACKAGVSDTFVRCSDDEYVWRPCHVGEMLPYHGGELMRRPPKFWSGGWKERLRRTADFLQSHGYPTKHFDTHIPTVTNRQLFMQAMSRSPYQRGKGFTINTLYLNQAALIDPPMLRHEKCTLEGSVADKEKIREALAGKLYLGFNDAGLTPALKEILEETFPEPSRYEMGPIVVPVPCALPQVVAVLGAGRSGTSCVAGILHHLGVSMGENLRQATPDNPRGFYEDLPLRDISRGKMPPATRVARLRAWASSRAIAGPIVGGKYGVLCNQVEEMAEAWPNMRAICVNRPMVEIVASMEKAAFYKRFTLQRLQEIATGHITRRDRDLARLAVPQLSVNYHDVLADPRAQVDRMVEWLAITPTPQQIDDACAFVDGGLHRNRLTAGPSGNALLVMNLNNFMPTAARDSMRDAAQRWGCEYVEITRPLASIPPVWQKTLIPTSTHAAPFDRVLVLDADMLIRSDCPSPFNLVPSDKIGVVSRVQPGNTLAERFHRANGRLRAPRLGLAPYAREEQHINGGLVLYSPSRHADLLRRWASSGVAARHLIKDGLHEQFALSCLLAESPSLAHFLPMEFNTIRATTVPQAPAGKMATYVYHFTGTRGRGLSQRMAQCQWRVA